MSFLRSVINKRLSSSKYPISPVKNHPSSKNDSIVCFSLFQYPLAIAGPLKAISPCSYFSNVFVESISSTIFTSEKHTGWPTLSNLSASR